MKKKLLLVLFTLFIGIIFYDNVGASEGGRSGYIGRTCKYIGSNSNGTLVVEFFVDKDKKGNFIIDGDALINGNIVSSDETDITDESQGVENWKKTQKGESISGADYYKNNNACPPYSIFVDRFGQFDLFVAANEADVAIYEEYAREKQGYQILKLVDQDLLNKKFTIKFVNTDSRATGSMSDLKDKVYDGIGVYIPKSGFNLYGFALVGFYVHNNGKVLCADGNYKSEPQCKGNFWIVAPDSFNNVLPFEPTNPIIELHTIWEPKSNISSQTVNQYKMGRSACLSLGYLWVDKGNYCNTDNLQYTMCGDAYDIPIEAPKLISYFVNILKIAAPIILIVTSIIKLLKALAAPNEDEIKKAQKSVIRKTFAAVMVFFVVSIVQFVILKVADYTELNSISKCMSCFLNNDCASTTYYKTNIGGSYFCTLIKDTHTGDIEPCIDFYNN